MTTTNMTSDYRETLSRLNATENWHVAGILDDVRANLADGAALAAIDALQSAVHDVYSLLELDQADEARRVAKQYLPGDHHE